MRAEARMAAARKVAKAVVERAGFTAVGVTVAAKGGGGKGGGDGGGDGGGGESAVAARRGGRWLPYGVPV